MVLICKENVYTNKVLKTTTKYVLIFCKLQSLDFKAFNINAARFLRIICDVMFINK